MSCPICQKRKPGRYCPAKGESICAVCCGTEREVTIDCLADCAYLAAAHRYESSQQRQLPPDTPLLDVRISQDSIYANQPVLSGLAFAIAKFAAANSELTDAGALEALQALAQTYRTLERGILYENPPALPLPRALYTDLSAFLQQAKQADPSPGAGPLRDSGILALLAFLYRMGLLRANGRPRSRLFLEFLRGQFPQAPDLRRETSRIIVP